MTTQCWKFWKFCLNLNRTWLHNIRRPRAEQLQKRFYNIKACHLFLRVEQETHNLSKNTTHFLIFGFQCKSTITIHANGIGQPVKKPTESWHKAVRNMSNRLLYIMLLIRSKRVLLSEWAVQWWTCIRTQFCLYKQHWCRNCRAIYPTVDKVCLWFLWFNQLLPEALETRRKHLYRTLFFYVVFLLLTHGEFFDAFHWKKFRLKAVAYSRD